MHTIFVRLPNHVGDVCMALPAVALLQQSGLRPVLFGKAWAGELLAAHGWDFHALGGQVRTDVGPLRRARNQAGLPRPRGLLLPNSFGSALLFSLAGVPAAGYRSDGRRLLLRWPLTRPQSDMHEVRVFWHVASAALHAWGHYAHTGEPPPQLGLKLADAAHERARAALAQAGAAGPYALVSAVTTGLHHGQTKHWPAMASVVEPLRARGLTVVAAPPAHEVEATRALLPDATLLAPLPLDAYAALARDSALVIANDSGASHVAAAAGARQVTLFGVTDRFRTGPWSPRAVCVGAADRWPDTAAVLAAIDRALALP